MFRQFTLHVMALLILLTPGRPQVSGTSANGSAVHGASTEEHLKQAGWWPRKDSASREEYAGPAVCEQCHEEIVKSQMDSAMARTASRAASSSNLLANDRRPFRVGDFAYELRRVGNNISYSVRAGAHSMTEPLDWAFGSAKVGQTYIFQKGDQTYEAAFSYFRGLHGFARTPGFDLVAPPISVPESLRNGAARPLEKSTAEGCFTCHTTASKTRDKLNPAQSIPNVTCEACHGPGAEHVAAEKANASYAADLAFNPKLLNPVASVDFCGACHRTWWDVMLTDEVGVSTILAIPYRLEKSRCWGTGDARLTCVACHDPHRPLETDALAYDQRCLSCHVATEPRTRDHPGSACPVGTAKCVTCHMKKYEVPDMHSSFTDHMIRVLKPGSSFVD